MHDDPLNEDPNPARLLARGRRVGPAAGWRSMMPGSGPRWTTTAIPDEWLEHDVAHRGRQLRTLDAVSTPGHTQGHFVFADPVAGLLFAGDHVLPTITPSIGFERAYVQQPLRDFLGSWPRSGPSPTSGCCPPTAR